jgi:hypothetical protein
LPASGSDEATAGGFFGDMTERSRLERKFRTAVGVRQQIAMSIAEHDPELAFSFYNDSLTAISNSEFRKQMEDRDTYFESQLMAQMADTNAAKAADIGRRSLEKGLTNQQIELLKKLYTKDPDRAAEFGTNILSRLKAEKPESVNLRAVSSLLEWGGTTFEASRKSGGKRSVYTQAELRDIADLLAQAIMSRTSESGFALRMADMLDKYSPGRGVQVRAKYGNARGPGPGRGRRGTSGAPPPAIGRGSANAGGVAVSGTDAGNANALRAQSEREERDRAEKRMFENAAKLSSKTLSREERERIVNDARQTIARLAGTEKKIAAFSFLAIQLNKTGEKELASEMLREAAALVNPQPKNYRDFMLSWVLATSYASAEPELAFPLLEDTIYRANDTIAAFVKVAEFIDVGEEIVADGELQVGAFGGAMVRGLTKELGMADATLQLLAKADFQKTCDLTNRFDRAEVRVLAKMLVLRAVLGPKSAIKNAKSDGVELISESQ